MMKDCWTWLVLICCGGLSDSGVILPSPDATGEDDLKQDKVVVEQRTIHGPPRVPNYNNIERDHENNDERYNGESREVGEFNDLDVPCQLLLQPFKAELMRDKSTFLVNVDPKGSNMHLVDLNMRKTQAHV